MTEIRQHLERAFEMLNRVTVQGASVDLLAAARQELRAAFQKTEKECTDESE